VLTLLVDILLFLICGNILKWLLHKPVGNTDFDLKVCQYSDKVHFDRKSGHVGFVVDRVTLGLYCPRLLIICIISAT
jgi:hypothetical protein